MEMIPVYAGKYIFCGPCFPARVSLPGYAVALRSLKGVIQYQVILLHERR